MNNNTPELWDKMWRDKVKFFPVYVMKRIHSLVPEDFNVLDIGCGTGSMLKKLQNKGCEVYGTDISPFAVRMCNEAGIPAVVWDSENMDDFVKDGVFDVVVTAHLLEHVDDDENLAKNIGRLTKEFALVCVPNNCAYPEHQDLHVRKYNVLTLMRLLNPYFKRFENHTVGNHLLLKCLP